MRRSDREITDMDRIMEIVRRQSSFRQRRKEKAWR